MSTVASQSEPSKIASPGDYRDVALEHLAADEHDLIAERDAYRELLSLALERLHALTALVERQGKTIRRLLEVTRAERKPAS